MIGSEANSYGTLVHWALAESQRESDVDIKGNAFTIPDEGGSGKHQLNLVQFQKQTSPSKLHSTTRKARNGYRPVSSDDQSDSEGDKKRAKFLERNRAAASKCRKKRRALERDLNDRARKLTTNNARLHAEVQWLRNEVLQLKCECLRHTDCNCEHIRDYLGRSVALANPTQQIQQYGNRSGSGLDADVMVSDSASTTDHKYQMEFDDVIDGGGGVYK